MQVSLGASKKTRAAADSSMLTEIRRRAAQSVSFESKAPTQYKPVFGVIPQTVQSLKETALAINRVGVDSANPGR